MRVFLKYLQPRGYSRPVQSEMRTRSEYCATFCVLNLEYEHSNIASDACTAQRCEVANFCPVMVQVNYRALRQL